MEKWKRRVFFWTLAFLFLIVVPALVLNARGYRFDLSRGVFVYSGTISVKSNPQSADVLLDGKVFEAKKMNRINSSYNLTGLIPKDYKIQLSFDGFHSWEKRIDVHSGVSSEFWNVILTRKNYERKNYALSGVERFYTSPKNTFIAYVKNNEQEIEGGLWNIEDEEISENFSIPQWKTVSREAKENVEWSHDDKYLSIPAEKSTPLSRTSKNPASESVLEKAYFIYDIEGKTSFSLNEFLGIANIRNVRWDSKDADYLFFISDEKLMRASVKDKNNLVQISENATAFDISGSKIYYSVRPNNIIYRSNLNGQNGKEQITADWPGGESDEIATIVIYDENRIGMISKDKNIFIYNHGDRDTYFRKLGENAQEVHFSDDGKKALFWSDNEIFVYFTRDWEVQPVRSENDLASITRYSEPIKNVQWFKDYEHIIFSTGPYVKIIELDPRDRRICLDLVDTKTDSPFVIYNSWLEKLYFVDKTGENSDLFTIIFPEPVPILGIGG